MHKIILFVFFFFSTLNTFSQITIEMEKINGVYYLPCNVNNLPLKFILDTGASRVSISETEALFMVKNGYLNKEDMGETEYYSLANGDVTEGLTVNLKTIEIGGIILKDIKASIVLEQKAPLLLGQTVLEKLGTYTIVGNQLILENYDNNSTDKLFLLDEKNGFKSIKIDSHVTEFMNYESQCFKSEEGFVCNIIDAPDELLTIFDKKMNVLVLIFDINTKLLKEIKIVKIYDTIAKTETEAESSSTMAINDYTYLSTMYSSALEIKPKLLDNEIFDLAGRIGSMSYWDSKNISLSILFEVADKKINKTGELEIQYTLTVSYKKKLKTPNTELLKKF